MNPAQNSKMKNLLSFSYIFSSILVFSSPTTIENLQFGDTPETVKSKLSDSETFHSTVPNEQIEQKGFNGAFQSKVKLYGIPYNLCFNFNDHGLSDLHFRSELQSPHEYLNSLHTAWEASVNLVTHIYGASEHSLPMPSNASIFKNTIMYSHIWQNGDTTILAGIGEDSGAYYSIITFSQTKVSELPKLAN